MTEAIITIVGSLLAMLGCRCLFCESWGGMTPADVNGTKAMGAAMIFLGSLACFLAGAVYFLK